MKTLGNSDGNGAMENVSDIQFFGNPDAFKLICKAWSGIEGWMKSTKAMEIPGAGCLVQVTTQQKNPDGSYSIAEALTAIPGVRIVEDTGPDGTVISRRLASGHPISPPVIGGLPEGQDKGFAETSDDKPESKKKAVKKPAKKTVKK